MLGQSYSGANFEIKHKCPVCQSAFEFKVASNLGEPDWIKVGELNPERIGMQRGCCAEALVFTQSLVKFGYIARVCQRLLHRNSSDES